MNPQDATKARSGANRYSSAYWETRVYRPTYKAADKRVEVPQF